MSKDKKNAGTQFNIIVPSGNKLIKHGFENTEKFREDVYSVVAQILN